MFNDLHDGETIEELFLNGIKIIQSKYLYRFTSDAVLLTKFAISKKNEILADFCSGSGIVALHFHALHPQAISQAHLFEIQKPLADMSERSIRLNGLEEKFTVHNTALQNIDKSFNEKFSLILCNPPYEKSGSGQKSLSESDAIARHETLLTLEELIKSAASSLKFGGRLCICHRADRLVDLLWFMRKYALEPKRIKYSQPKSKPAYLVFVEGVKGGKPGIKTELPFEN